MSGKIVFINQATGYLTIDIINEFAKEFEEVVLITGSVRVQDIALLETVKIEFITRYNRGNKVRKALSWLIGTFQIYLLLKFRYKTYDKFFFTIPPTAYLMAPCFKGLFSLAVFDIYPEALMANGFSENGFLYSWWAKRNRKILPISHRVFTLSDSMKAGILKYSSKVNVRVIPNWSAFSDTTPVRKEDNMILKMEGLTGKFIVQYSGNIGVTHNVETLVDIAEFLKDDEGIVFQIIGRGDRKFEIDRRIKDKGLTNCLLLPFREDNTLFESLSAADLAIIILDDKTSDISVPSKTFNIMAAGLPVMAIASPDSGISEMILRHQIGRTFEKHDISGMSSYIFELKNNNTLWRCLSANSLKASRSYTNANASLYLEYYIE